ncbi:hypothetical protein [Streptomyces sp. YIM 98790]|uniref:hypothetical protein n=1 Tax=Streptomyces sp. YIM 98790 TaxID=2689077 RepID=UPI0014082B61|nr:hypothetical protein [Streptomyces sp. YIM 98790]
MAGRKQCDAIQFVRRQPRALFKALAAFGWMWMPRPAEADVPGTVTGPGADDVSGPAGARRLPQSPPGAAGPTGPTGPAALNRAAQHLHPHPAPHPHPHPWPAWADPVAGAWAGRWIFDDPPPGHPERLVAGPLSPLETELARELHHGIRGSRRERR